MKNCTQLLKVVCFFFSNPTPTSPRTLVIGLSARPFFNHLRRFDILGFRAKWIFRVPYIWRVSGVIHFSSYRSSLPTCTVRFYFQWELMGHIRAPRSQHQNTKTTRYTLLTCKLKMLLISRLQNPNLFVYLANRNSVRRVNKTRAKQK